MNSNWKIVIAAVTGLIIGISIGMTVGLATRGFFAAKWAKTIDLPVTALDRDLLSLAEMTNKICPVMIDKHTRLENAVSVPGTKTIQHRYTLLNLDELLSSAELTVVQFQNNMFNALKNNVKSNPELSELRRKNVIFKYTYSDENQIHLFDIVVLPKDYK